MNEYNNSEPFFFVTSAKETGQRIDQVLVNHYPELSRSTFQRLLRAGDIRVDGQSVKPKHILREGEEVRGAMPPPEPAEPEPEDIPIDVLHSDDDLIVINKQPGLVVHPAAGNLSGTLVNALLHRFDFLSGVGGVQRPGIVHRLDKDTSGLIIVARNDGAHQRLQEMIQARTVKRRYLALLSGELNRLEGRIDAPIGRHQTSRLKKAVNERDGREAVTLYRRLAAGNGLSLAQADLQTGRTHQIRVHFAHIGHPVVGDSMYGWNPDRAASKARRAEKNALAEQLHRAKRQMLHAWQLNFPHPGTGEPLEFKAPPPEDFLEILREAFGEIEI